MRIKVWLVILFTVLTAGCSIGSGIQRPPLEIGPDPTFTFTMPTGNCDGGALTVGSGVNIYAVQGPGPMATVAITGLVPAVCNGNQINVALATKLNATPLLTGSAVTLSVSAPGQWTFCAEAINPSGSRSLISDCITKTVSNNPNAPTLLNVAGVEIGIKVAMVE